MAYSAFTAGQVDADSPVDIVLTGKIKDNDDYFKGLFHIATGHTHDGASTDDGPPVVLAPSVVARGELKTTMSSVSTTSADEGMTLPGGEYGFYPQVKANATTDDVAMFICSATSGNNFVVAYVTHITLQAISGPGTPEAFAQQRYIQASPPYMIGDVQWGHFIFLLRNISTGEVVSKYQAEDPPWAYNGRKYPKDDVRNMQEIPHPFIRYWGKDPSVDGLEIVMLETAHLDTVKWREDNYNIGKDPLEELQIILPGKGTKKTIIEAGIPEIIGFTDKIQIVRP